MLGIGKVSDVLMMHVDTWLEINHWAATRVCDG